MEDQARSPGPEVFRTTPFRSYYFVAPTILAAMPSIAAVLVFVKVHSALSLFGSGSIVLSCLPPIRFWLLAFRNWQRMNYILQENDAAPDTPLFLALDMAAKQMFFSLTFLGFTAATLILTIGSVAGRALGHIK